MGIFEYFVEYAFGEYFFFLSMLFNFILFYYFLVRIDFFWLVIRFLERFLIVVFLIIILVFDVDRSYFLDIIDIVFY